MDTIIATVFIGLVLLLFMGAALLFSKYRKKGNAEEGKCPNCTCSSAEKKECDEHENNH